MKPKKCKFCKDLFTPSRPLQFLCSFQCALKWTSIEDEKKKKAEWKKEKKLLKEKVKRLSDFEKEARAEFQKWIRLVRDKDLPCISCGKFSNRYDAGHYFDAGVYSGLIFNEDNVHKQCSNFCNRMNHGNKPNYRIGLVKKIGLKRVKKLEGEKDKLRSYKYTREELISIKEKYKKLNAEK